MPNSCGNRRLGRIGEYGDLGIKWHSQLTRMVWASNGFRMLSLPSHASCGGNGLMVWGCGPDMSNRLLGSIPLSIPDCDKSMVLCGSALRFM